MKLVDASRYFDRTEALDPVTGKRLFYGQIDPFDDSKRDAYAAYRRILSVAPGTVMPVARAVRMLGTVWVVGGHEPDGLSTVHREKYVIQASTGKVNVSRLSGFLAGTVASTPWACINWVKNSKQIDVASTEAQKYLTTLPSGSDVRAQDILWETGSAYLVLAAFEEASGYLGAECVKLDQATPLVASLVARSYDPITGTYTSSAPVSVNALAVRWQDLFEYNSQVSDHFKPGDVSIVLPAGTSVNTAAKLTLSSITYQIVAVMDIAGAVVLHARAT